MTTQYIQDADELDALPVGSRIKDNGMVATKTDGGAWWYQGAGYWEPSQYPVKRLADSRSRTV
jgi:hypothetical protein